MPDTRDALVAALRATPPAEFDVLPPEHQARLAGMVDAAAKARTVALESAIDDSLRHLPWVLRGPVRLALGLA